MNSDISDQNTSGYVKISDEDAVREVVSKVIGGLWESRNRWLARAPA